jgi:hypothetical protein
LIFLKTPSVRNHGAYKNQTVHGCYVLHNVVNAGILSKRAYGDAAENKRKCCEK